jgi:hypothetical protein
MKIHNEPVIMVTADMVRRIAKKRFPDVELPNDVAIELADEAANMISSGWEDAIDQVVMMWARRTAGHD